MRIYSIVVAICAAVALAGVLHAQETDRINDLEERIRKLESARDEDLDTIDLMKKELDQLKAKKEPARINLFNPAITVFVDAAARIDNKTVLDATGKNEIDDRIFVRTAEVDFRAPVDPYVDAVTIISLEGKPDGGFEADLEEGYGIIKKLPILESAPLGMKVKAGKYRAPLGVNNKYHLHDVMWTTRPLPVARYLGTEHGEFFESGFVSEGAGVSLFLPSLPGSTLTGDFHVFNSGDIGITKGNGGRNPGMLSRLEWFATFGGEHDVTLGASGYREGGGLSSGMAAADFTYKWKPAEKGEFHSVLLGGEAFYSSRKYVDPLDVERSNTPFGYYVYGQYQLDWHTFLGVRYDTAEALDDDAIRTNVMAAYVSYYTSEFFRMRLGFEHRESDIPDEDGVNSVLIELSYVFGSHPVEPYWVGR